MKQSRLLHRALARASSPVVAHRRASEFLGPAAHRRRLLFFRLTAFRVSIGGRLLASCIGGRNLHVLSTFPASEAPKIGNTKQGLMHFGHKCKDICSSYLHPNGIYISAKSGVIGFYTWYPLCSHFSGIVGRFEEHKTSIFGLLMNLFLA